MDKISKTRETSQSAREATARPLREAAATRVEHTSLRAVAREIGMSPSGLKSFLNGTAPYSPTLRRLRNWYVQYAAVESGPVVEEVASAAVMVLVQELDQAPRGRTAAEILDSLARGYEASGKIPPQ